ncbi:MAG: hypothetical protein JXR77_16510 [Lentisphaeria bacterium]|nr:hypothetical protein [Lentisphaeria bacterium]
MRAVAVLIGLGPVAVLTLWLCWGWGEPPLPDPVPPPVRPAEVAALPPAPAGDAVTGPKQPIAAAPVPQPQSPAEPEPAAADRSPDGQTSSDHSILTFLVLDESSQPIPGARVRLSETQAVTDAHGTARLCYPHGGDCWFARFHCAAPGYETAEVFVTDASVPRMVWLRRGQRISGTCVDSVGSPIPSLKLTLRPDAPGCPDLDLTTDAQGRFASTEAGQQAYTLVVEDPRWIASVPPVVPPEEGLRVVLFRPARLTGRLQFFGPKTLWHNAGCAVFFRRGLPRRDLGATPPARRVLPARRVRVQGPRQPGLPFAFECLPGWVTLSLGEHVIARVFVREGEVHDSGIHAVVPEAWAVADAEREPGQENEVREQDNNNAADTPTPTARVRGYLMDMGGQPVTQGTLELCPAGTRGAAIGVQEEHDEFPRCTRPSSMPSSPAPSSFARGIFDLAGVASGTYDLVWMPRAWWSGWQPRVRAVLRRAIRIPEPAADADLGTVVLDLRATAFSVRVLAASGGCVPGAIVWLMDECRVEAAARTDAFGLATFRVFDPTGLEIAVGPPEARTMCGALPVTVGQTSEPITVTLPE